jgi:hypothetical protein
MVSDDSTCAGERRGASQKGEASLHDLLGPSGPCGSLPPPCSLRWLPGLARRHLRGSRRSRGPRRQLASSSRSRPHSPAHLERDGLAREGLNENLRWPGRAREVRGYRRDNKGLNCKRYSGDAPASCVLERKARGRGWDREGSGSVQAEEGTRGKYKVMPQSYRGWGVGPCADLPNLGLGARAGRRRLFATIQLADHNRPTRVHCCVLD